MCTAAWVQPIHQHDGPGTEASCALSVCSSWPASDVPLHHVHAIRLYTSRRAPAAAKHSLCQGDVAGDNYRTPLSPSKPLKKPPQLFSPSSGASSATMRAHGAPPMPATRGGGGGKGDVAGEVGGGAGGGGVGGVRAQLHAAVRHAKPCKSEAGAWRAVCTGHPTKTRHVRCWCDTAAPPPAAHSRSPGA